MVTTSFDMATEVGGCSLLDLGSGKIRSQFSDEMVQIL